jgi:hypothetical protein
VSSVCVATRGVSCLCRNGRAALMLHCRSVVNNRQTLHCYTVVNNRQSCTTGELHYKLAATCDEASRRKQADDAWQEHQASTATSCSSRSKYRTSTPTRSSSKYKHTNTQQLQPTAAVLLLLVIPVMQQHPNQPVDTAGPLSLHPQPILTPH